MNLLFWKKKTAIKDSADISPEDSDNDMTGQESRDEESPDQDLADSEFAKKSGLYERMKAGFAALTQRTKKTPASGTEENIDSSADTQASSGHESEDSDAVMETTEKPGLFARIKSRLVALTGRFKKAPDAGDEDEFLREKPVAEESAEDVAAIKPKHSKKFWIIGGVALLLILLGVGIYVALDYILPPLTRNNLATRYARERQEALEAASKQAEPLEVLPIVAPPQSAIEPAKNELQQSAVQPDQPAQAQSAVQAAQSAVQQAQSAVQPAQPIVQPAQSAVQSAAQPAKQPAKALPASNKGDVVVGNKEPKDTAMSLKKAIETMNKELGEPVRKPAK